MRDRLSVDEPVLETTLDGHGSGFGDKRAAFAPSSGFDEGPSAVVLDAI
jgi:hypothetical protein